MTATTAGEIASLTNAFVVQPGTPLILSSGPSSAQQQQNITFTILGQSTQWVNGTTTVNCGQRRHDQPVNVTSPTRSPQRRRLIGGRSPGYRTLTVTTGAQVLTLPFAFVRHQRPAAISALNPPPGRARA